MSNCVRLVFGFGIVAAILGGGRLASGPLSNMHNFHEICRLEAERAEQLDGKLSVYLRRQERKERIINDVIDRRLTFDEALARFRQMYQHYPEHLRELARMRFEVGTDEEVNRRRVLTLIEWELEERRKERQKPAHARTTEFRSPLDPAGLD